MGYGFEAAKLANYGGIAPMEKTKQDCLFQAGRASRRQRADAREFSCSGHHAATASPKHASLD
jgi:hypothetical protein